MNDRQAWPALALAMIGLVLPVGRAAAQTASAPAEASSLPLLFSAAPLPTVATPPTRKALVTRSVNVDMALLTTLGPGSRFGLNLLPGAEFTAQTAQVVQRGPGRFSIAGILEEDTEGTFLIVVEDGVTSGLVQSPLNRKSMKIGFLGGAGVHAVSQLNHAAFGECDVSEGPPLKGAAGLPAALGGTDQAAAGDVIVNAVCTEPQPVWDVLILYSDDSRSAMGGTSAINAECQLAIDGANVGYGNSLINARTRLVYRGEVSYDESGASYATHLDRLTDPSDSVLDNAHTLRSTHNADFVSLWLNDDDAGTICGRANCSIAASQAFSVCNWDCAVSNFSFHHEIGHNQGCAHNTADAGSGCNEDSYSFGWRFFGASGSGFRTTMAYDNAAGDYMRINFFSNPNVTFDGRATGKPVGDANEAYNAKTISDRRRTYEDNRNSNFDVWVNFGAGVVQNGSFTLPYDTIAEGHAKINPGVGASETPVLHVVAGVTNETPTLNKPLILIPCGGTVRIGG